MRKSRRPSPVTGRRLATIAAAGCALYAPCAEVEHAHAQQQEMVEVSVDRLEAESFPINDKDPESSVPSMEQAMQSPLKMGYHVMLLIEKGQQALDAENYTAAVKYYRAMTKAVPERSRGFALLCEAYRGAGDQQSALENCKLALAKAGVTVEDNLRYVDLVLKKPGQLSAADVEDIDALIAHLEGELKSEPSTPVMVNQLKCELATRLEDVQRLSACSAKLRELAPTDPKTTAYTWALKVAQRDFAGAQSLITQAARDGLPKEALAKMQSGLLLAREKAAGPSWLQRWGATVSIGVGVLAAALGGLVLLLRRKQLDLGRMLRLRQG